MPPMFQTWLCNAMLERTTRSYFDSILSKDFARLQGNGVSELDTKRASRQTRQSDAIDEDNMTRRTRTRRPRIPVLQSGYCAVCNVPYNSVQDHIQSKKHQKLIGEDANYIALNGSLNGFLQNDSIPFLNLNGVDAIGVHDSSFDEFSPKYKKRTMHRRRACSVMSDKVKSSPLSPGIDITGHRLRSRKNINYMSPPSDDDSLQEKPDLGAPEEPANHGYKEYRELRSSTKALAKLTEQAIPSNDPEVWNSGRPKRACINKKRRSTDDDAKTFYKVEVLASKNHQKIQREPRRSQSPKRDEDKAKALIVKFKKMRNSELVRLNSEATNFLFPQKDDSGSDGDEVDDASECDGSARLSCSDVGDCNDSSHSFKCEDELSMDSTSSSTKGKKKRRTHAEAFIMDNQKYYKFETPGSRLRYHGTYLPAVQKSPKFNGAFSPKAEEARAPEEPREKRIKCNPDAKVKLDNYKFSFEKVPRLASWYGAFRRIDTGQQTYIEFSDYFADPFLLPYQMPAIPPLDPRLCLAHYGDLRNRLREPAPQPPCRDSRSTTPDASATGSSYQPEPDDDSELSVATASSRSSGGDGGQNPRKSPRQHASTLAILSSLIQQRRKRAKNKLPPIPEEPPEAKPPARKTKPRIDYYAMARSIDKELDSALDDNPEHYDLDVALDHTVDFHRSRTSLADVLRLYDEDEPVGGATCRRLLHGPPNRKPVRRKRTNKTGWPNKNRRTAKREAGKEEEEEVSESEEGSESDRDNGHVLMNKETNSELQFQPYVRVQKLEAAKEVEAAPKRTKRRVRHMPGSPKSPRMLRRPRGRWYRER